MKTKEVMSLKKAIQVLEIEQGEHTGERYREYFDEIIDLLKRGEKYEKIIEQLKQNYGHNNVRFGFGEGETLEHAINHLIWIYFPKEDKK